MRITLKHLVLLLGIAVMAVGYTQVTKAEEQPSVDGETALPTKDRAPEEVIVELNKGRMIKLDRPIASVAISDPLTADVQVVSQKMLFVRGKKVGETTLYAADAADNMVFSAVLQVTHNISNLQAAIKRVSPESDIALRSVDGGLVMEGNSPSIEESAKISDVASAFLGENDRLVNMIKTAGSDQVTLQVRIVEIQRTSLKNLGINLQAISNKGNFTMQLLQGDDILFHTDDPEIFAYNTPSSVLVRPGTTVASNLFFGYKDVGGLIEALETKGVARVLAEPTLTTTTGKAASFLAGGQFPLPVLGSNNTVTIQYQPFGVSLNFTPIVMSKKRISLTVAPEVSTLNFNNPIQVSNVTYPILNTRKASSVLEMGSGDTFMLAGLLQSEASQTINKFPGVGDLPVLGSLFRSQSFQDNQTELVILVTPYIVRPVAERAKMQVPTDGFMPPNDLQRLLLGNLYQQEPLKEDAPQTVPSLHGGGFMLGE